MWGARELRGALRGRGHHGRGEQVPAGNRRERLGTRWPE